MGLKKSRGLSLVELMIALALSLFLVAGLIYVFLGSRQAYSTSTALAQVQESGRFALEFVARDLRHAGYNGLREACGDVDFFKERRATLLASPESVQEEFVRVALSCFDGDTDFSTHPECAFLTTPEPPDPVQISDPGNDQPFELDIFHGRLVAAGGMPILNHRRTSTPKELWVFDEAEVLEDGDVVTAVDRNCDYTTIFQVNGLIELSNPGVDHNRIVRFSAGGSAPGNRSDEIGQTLTDGLLFRGIPIPGFLSQDVVQYRVQNRVLTRRGLEVVDGVEGFQVLEVEDDLFRIRLLTVSRDDNVIDQPQHRCIFYDVSCNDASEVFGDRRLRQAFEATVSLRNPL